MTDNCHNSLSPVKAWGIFFEALVKYIMQKITFFVDLSSFHATVNTIKEILVLVNVLPEDSILN